MDLVVGATGLLGTEICRRLRDRRDDVRALVRKTSEALKVERLRSFGCEIVIGDLQDKASLDRACKGNRHGDQHRDDDDVAPGSRLARENGSAGTAEPDRRGGAQRRQAIRAHVVLGQPGRRLELHVAKRTVEEKLRESGVSYTILRPSCFMEVWFSPALGFDAKNRKAQIFGAGDEPLSFISLFDVAEFAVRAASSDKAANQTLELGGPEPVAPNEVVKIFEREMGGPFEVTHVPVDALKQQYAAATDSYQKAFTSLMLDYCVGDEIDMTDPLKSFR